MPHIIIVSFTGVSVWEVAAEWAWSFEWAWSIEWVCESCRIKSSIKFKHTKIEAFLMDWQFFERNMSEIGWLKLCCRAACEEELEALLHLGGLKISEQIMSSQNFDAEVKTV